MKRTFLKVLPFAAALLLATSCSKDDNNSTDEIVNNGGDQIETVTKTFKTLTVKGKVNKSISKVTTNQDETALAFEGGDQFTFGSETDDVYGTITIKDANGNYEATINYTNESALSGDFTASLGSNPETISTAYENLAAAVQGAYYTINFTINQEAGEYKLKSGNSEDIVVYLQSAFIKALSAETAKLGGTDITVEADKYYVVPVGQAMGETQNTTIAGKIYNLGSAVPEYVDLGVELDDGTKVYFSSTVTPTGVIWSEGHADWPTVNEFKNLVSDCYWQWDNTQGHNGYYVFKTHAEADKGQITNTESSYSPSTSYSIESDPCIFLPLSVGNYGYYWSRESLFVGMAYCLTFLGHHVNPSSASSTSGVEPGVVTVRRSN